MNNEVIYRGLRLKSQKCRYFQVKEGNINSIVEDTQSSCLTLTYVPGSTAKSLSIALGIQTVGNDGILMQPTGPKSKKFESIIVSLNGFKLQKLTANQHVISVVIVSDSESRVVQNYDRTIFVVNKNDYKNPEFLNFLFYSGNLLFLKPIGKLPNGYQLRNFPKLIIGDSNLDLTSDSETIFTLRKRYNDYVIREIDYQDQFILEIRRILDDYGIELVRFNKEVSLAKTSYVTYQFNQTPTQYSHPKRGDIDRGIISHRQPIDFVLHTPDMVLYHDFKNKYSNVNLLTNFVEFKTTDRYGDRWTAGVRWYGITEDYSGNVYQQDDNSNFAHQCQFRCELYFYEVLDTRYEFLKEISLELDQEDLTSKGKVITNDKI